MIELGSHPSRHDSAGGAGVFCCLSFSASIPTVLPRNRVLMSNFCVSEHILMLVVVTHHVAFALESGLPK